jgi:hypothetical protein
VRISVSRAAFLVASLACSLAAPAAADMLLLKDGRVVEGPKIEEQEDGYHVKFSNGEVVVPKDQVKDCLVQGDQGYVPRDDEEKARLEKGLVPFEGRWVPKAERDAAVGKKIAEKKKRLEEAKAHREWRNRYTVKTANFDFEFTIPPDVAKGYMELMETYYSVFTKYWGIQRPPKAGKLKVCFYRDYDSFLETSGAGYGTLAYYRFVDPRELNFYYDRLDPEETIAIMFHEANHYLSHLVDLDFSYPHCIGEAMAEYYGGSRWDPVKKQMDLGHVQDGRLTEVMTDMQGGEMKKLEDYLRGQLGYDDYTWGWSFVHFMMETPKYTPKFKQFFLALARAKDIQRTGTGRHRTVLGEEFLRAFKKHMGVQDLSKLEQEWYEHVKALKFEGVRGYERAALAALSTGQKLKATRYFKLALEKGSKNPAVYLRYSSLLLSDNKAQEAVDLLKKGIPFDPMNADLYAALGRATRRLDGDANKAEGKRLLELAREIDPDNVELDLLIEEAVGKVGEAGN